MIKFFNIKTGETRILDPATMDPQFIEPAIAALYNSSNLHVNATRGQDFGWRIAPETVKRIRDIKRDDAMINRIAAGTQILPENISDTDILTWIVKDDARKEALKNEAAEEDYSAQYEAELRAVGASPREYNPATEIPSIAQPAIAPEDEAETEEDLEAQAAKAAKANEKTPAQKKKEQEEEDRLMAELEAEEAEEKRLKDAGSEVGDPAAHQANAEEAAATTEALSKDKADGKNTVAKTQAKADNKSNS